jgi:hypothetical protein
MAADRLLAMPPGSTPTRSSSFWSSANDRRDPLLAAASVAMRRVAVSSLPR